MNFKHFILTTTLFLISCTNMSLTPEVVRKSDVQKQQYVVIGTILDVTSVTIEGDRETGAAAGALIGGSVGKNVTDSEPESDIAAIIGGIVGSAVGAELGANLTQKNGIELLILTIPDENSSSLLFISIIAFPLSEIFINLPTTFTLLL